MAITNRALEQRLIRLLGRFEKGARRDLLQDIVLDIEIRWDNYIERIETYAAIKEGRKTSYTHSHRSGGGCTEPMEASA